MTHYLVVLTYICQRLYTKEKYILKTSCSMSTTTIQVWYHSQKQQSISIEIASMSYHPFMYDIIAKSNNQFALKLHVCHISEKLWIVEANSQWNWALAVSLTSYIELSWHGIKFCRNQSVPQQDIIQGGD